MNLREWLFTPCSEHDLLPSKDQHGKTIEGVYYMPKAIVDGKLREMEEEYGGKIDVLSFNHFFHNMRDGSMIVSGHVSIHLYGNSGLSYKLMGSSTFEESRFGDNRNFGAILLTLSITQALSRKFPQFGSLLLKEDLEVALPTIQVDEKLNKATNTINSITKGLKK